MLVFPRAAGFLKLIDMGMSTHVVGFVSPEDDTYKKHCMVLAACIAAGVSLPIETATYFGGKHPYKSMAEEKLEIEIPIHEWSGDMAEGYEVLLSEITQGVHKIRFCNSW